MWLQAVLKNLANIAGFSGLALDVRRFSYLFIALRLYNLICHIE